MIEPLEFVDFGFIECTELRDLEWPTHHYSNNLLRQPRTTTFR